MSYLLADKPSAARRDPFGRGLAAHRAHLPRESCPHVPDHAEGKLWLAGWDMGADA